MAHIYKLEALLSDRFVAFGLGTPGRQGEGHVIAIGTWDDLLTATPEYPLQDAVDAARAAQCRYEDAEKSGYFDALDPLPQPECGKLAVAHVGDLICNGYRWLPQQLLMAIIDALLAEGPVVDLSDAAIAPTKIYGMGATNMRRDFTTMCAMRGADIRLVDDGKDGTLWALFPDGSWAYCDGSQVDTTFMTPSMLDRRSASWSDDRLGGLARWSTVKRVGKGLAARVSESTLDRLFPGHFRDTVDRCYANARDVAQGWLDERESRNLARQIAAMPATADMVVL